MYITNTFLIKLIMVMTDGDEGIDICARTCVYTHAHEYQFQVSIRMKFRSNLDSF